MRILNYILSGRAVICLTIVGLMLALGSISAAACDITLTGRVIDPISGNYLDGAVVQVYDAEISSDTTSVNGEYSIPLLCEGGYHIRILVEGWQSDRRYITIQNDTVIDFILESHNHHGQEISVFGDKHTHKGDYNLTISSNQIGSTPDISIAEVLESLPNATSIKNGNNIAKPVVEGVFGSRLSIVSAGSVIQAQSWGIDHAPEIDPLAASSITIASGVDNFKYQGSQIGSSVIVDPLSPARDPHLHGGFRGYLVSNGRGGGSSLNIGIGGEKFGIESALTVKKTGDLHTPDYYLNNTGFEQISGSINLEYSLLSDLLFSTYYSNFTSEIGVLKGAHVGSLSDLERAIGSKRPFYTEPNHSYDIDAPKQNVAHQLYTARLAFTGIKNIKSELSASYQTNLREEYDVRRSGRSSIPSLSLSKSTFSTELTAQWHINDKFDMHAGTQLTSISNKNDPATGILPLIPDYVENMIGGFGTAHINFGESDLDFGFRFDYINRDSRAISRTIPREILRYEQSAPILSTGVSYSFSLLSQEIGTVAKYANRLPDVSELYSNGLHQGTGGIERGNPNLNTENMFFLGINTGNTITEKLSYDLHFYQRYFGNYIYLTPTGETELTIRGAFPLFIYQQTEAYIYGFELSIDYDLTEEIHAFGNLAIIRGEDITGSMPLVYMPSNRAGVGTDYHTTDILGIDMLDITSKYEYIFRQDDLLPVQDFLEPPPGYGLLSLSAKGSQTIGGSRLVFISLRLDNLLNTTYRHYMNRLRYFADAMGFSATLTAGYEF